MRRGKKTVKNGISFPAREVWQVYSTLVLPEIIKNIPNYVKDIKVNGDGSVGTTYEIWNLPGDHLPLSPSLEHSHVNWDRLGLDRF